MLLAISFPRRHALTYKAILTAPRGEIFLTKRRQLEFFAS